VRRKNNYLLDLTVVILSGIIASVTLSSFNSDKSTANHNHESAEIETIQDINKFGFDTQKYHFDDYKIEQDMYLSDVLLYEGIDFKKIVQLETNSKDIFSLRHFKAGKDFTLIRDGECESPICMVYEPDRYTYVQYFFNEKATIQKINKPTETCLETTSGIIEGSLWDAMISRNLSPSLIDKMEDALSSSVDFYHTQKGDKFYLLYEEIYVEGQKVGVGDVLGASYEDARGKHYAVYYENERYGGHYDLEGHPTKSQFLRAPVKYSRISSRFSYSRFHPIKKRRIPHLGTDYAAAGGTPIFAVADGFVEKAAFTRNNGKYVKIKHDKTYQSQYLHMSGFAKGIKCGTRVKQGQVIGYVGKTGLATGNHVCFRFWKNGKQINHLRENFPPADPLPANELPQFFSARDNLLEILNDIPEPISSETFALAEE